MKRGDDGMPLADPLKDLLELVRTAARRGRRGASNAGCLRAEADCASARQAVTRKRPQRLHRVDRSALPRSAHPLRPGRGRPPVRSRGRVRGIADPRTRTGQSRCSAGPVASRNAIGGCPRPRSAPALAQWSAVTSPPIHGDSISARTWPRSVRDEPSRLLSSAEADLT